MPETILITGAAGWLGGLLAATLSTNPQTSTARLVLVDIFEPKRPVNSNAHTLKADLTNKDEINQLFQTEFGVPETVYCLHGIMSRGSEDNFELGVRVNVDSVRALLEVTRTYSTASKPIKVIFSSSLAVYGGPLPAVIKPETGATPQGSYGMEKLMSELLVNEYSRRGWVDGRILRLPTIVVRPGPPSNATSAFMSGIIREPLQGLETVCPIGNSLESPELSLPLWLASPETTIENFIIARGIDSAKLMPHTRVICLPGFTATVKDELDALKAVAGVEALGLVKFEDDPTNRRIVSSWPSAFDNTYPLSLGFRVDEGGMVPIVQRFRDNLKQTEFHVVGLYE